MGSLNDRRNRRLSWAVGVGLALVAGASLADAPKSAAEQPGLMTFPNVKVVNAPATVGQEAQSTKSQSATQSQGLRAYVDASTGRLRQQTIEEGKQIADETKAKVAAKASRSRTRGASLSSETAAGEGETIYGEGGAIGMTLSDEQQVYQVVRKSDAGLQSGEFSGKSAADAALKAPLNDKSSEVNHDR